MHSEVINGRPYYDLHWARTGGKEHPYVAEKIDIILKTIPQDVKTIVDVGCGDGTITNVLAEKYVTVGGDISLVGLRHLSPAAQPVVMGANFIPFHDYSFDLVFSSELLEHLADNIFPKAISEIKRISKKYILITVPNNEKLRSRFTKCSECSFEFHIYYHERSFDLKKLARHFNGYSIAFSTLCGAPDNPSFEPISYLRNKVGNSYFFLDTISVLCPNCGKTTSSFKSNLMRRLVGHSFFMLQNVLNLVLNRRPQPDWLVVLFDKSAAGAKVETGGR